MVQGYLEDRGCTFTHLGAHVGRSGDTIGKRWKKRGSTLSLPLTPPGSMLADDVKPNRLQAAKREIEDLLNVLEGDRVALVAFAGAAFYLLPFDVRLRGISAFSE